MARKLIFSPRGWRDYQSWIDDRKAIRRVNTLIRDALRTPDSGAGKPKPLSGDLQGLWSRRIDEEHRLVYVSRDDSIEIAMCRTHYQ
ncbi:Txe/YoeB family addiction module toxin [Bacillus sp. NP157]|nr:Txe/YoeB family addiction module toxin [Bacillus sp. NP157]